MNTIKNYHTKLLVLLSIVIIVVVITGCNNSSNTGSLSVPGSSLNSKPSLLSREFGNIPRSSKLLGYALDPTDNNNDIRGSGTALILFDSSGQYGWMGGLYAKEMANLLSHFSLTVTSKKVENYTAGDIENFDSTFYIGVVYDNALKDALINDVIKSTKPVCWIGYNLWKAAWTPDMTNVNPVFESKFGIRFNGLDNSGYNAIQYKGQTLTKSDLDQTIGKIEILNSSIASASATCSNASASNVPYITHAGNLWYIADCPFVYVSMTDRYLAFVDILHDILNIQHQEQHRAVIRIEDVSPANDPARLRQVADYLYSQNTPFAISVIPEYRDPLGTYNSGVAETIKMANAPEVVSAIKYMVSKGGEVVQHGYTHQYSNVANPDNGVTGDDYEFFKMSLDGNRNIVYDGPLPEDSKAWAKSRVNTGKNILTKFGLNPVAWLTPHYIASPNTYRAVKTIYPVSLDRSIVFYTGSDGIVYFIEQLCPFYMKSDQFGISRIPETIGYVDPWGFGTIQPPALPPVLLSRADSMWVVRDGWAGCYFHPYLDIQYLKDLVSGLKGRGYQFVAPSQAN